MNYMWAFKFGKVSHGLNFTINRLQYSFIVRNIFNILTIFVIILFISINICILSFLIFLFFIFNLILLLLFHNHIIESYNILYRFKSIFIFGIWIILLVVWNIERLNDCNSSSNGTTSYIIATLVPGLRNLMTRILQL